MKCVVLQPSYIPWRGYFHQIKLADLFIFYDDVQYDKGGWRNRNRIRTPNGSSWVTIPINRNRFESKKTLLKDVFISWNTPWNEAHRRQLDNSYHKAPFYGQFDTLLSNIYGKRPDRLVDFTIETTILLAEALGIDDTHFMRSSDIILTGRKSDRLMVLLKHVGATHYISGPSARNYLDQARFDREGITLKYIAYDYPEYPQLYPPFDPQVSILDLMFMVGKEAKRYIWDA